MGLEPTTSSLGSCAGVVPTDNPQELATTPDSSCTNSCTNSTPAGENFDPLANLADALRRLSPADRDRLAHLMQSPKVDHERATTNDSRDR